MLDQPTLLTSAPGRLGEAELWAATRDAIEPAEALTPLEFGARHRVYGKEGRSARWDPDETPWVHEILWALSDASPYRRVVSPKGTQLGFTEIGLIWAGQGAVEGQSTLIIEPTESVAKRVVKGKFRPFIQSTPILRAMFPGRSADTSLHFSSPSVDVIFAGSNSPSNFASTTVPRVMGDEVDRWSPELTKEGDPVDLLENRIAEYGFLGKMFLPSSPTVEGHSIVWREWEQSDQRVFECPCPVCDHFQEWKWENMERDAEGRVLPNLVCVACGEASPEHRWKAEWRRGRWRATNPDPIRKDSAGFHLSTLYARYGQRTWAQLVQQYEAVMASGLPARIQTFWNTVLGLPWKLSEDAVAADELRKRLEPGEARGLVPAEALLLTAGADYQRSPGRVEVHVWAWGRQMESWPVEVVHVSRVNADGTMRPSRDIAADLKREVLDVDWPHALGGSLRIELTLHDVNDGPADVFDVLEHLPSSRNIARHGREGWGQKQLFTAPKTIDVKRDGKVVMHGRRQLISHTAEAKREFYADLRRGQAEEGPSERFVHLPEWYGDEEGLIEGLVSEEIRKTTRGKPYWHKVYARNEPLDCRIMARGAHWQLKAHRWSEAEWARRQALVATAKSETPPPASSQGTVAGRRIRGRIR